MEQSEDGQTAGILPIPQPGDVQGAHSDRGEIRTASSAVRVCVAPRVEDDEVAGSGAHATAHVGSLLRAPVRELPLL